MVRRDVMRGFLQEQRERGKGVAPNPGNARPDKKPAACVHGRVELRSGFRSSGNSTCREAGIAPVVREGSHRL